MKRKVEDAIKIVEGFPGIKWYLDSHVPDNTIYIWHNGEFDIENGVLKPKHERQST